MNAIHRFLASTALITVLVFPLSTHAVTITNTLAVGAKGSDVSALQQFLIEQGYLQGQVTGYFGQLTQSAVKAYQSAHGLEAVGTIGPRTRALINGAVTSASSSVPNTTRPAADVLQKLQSQFSKMHPGAAADLGAAVGSVFAAPSVTITASPSTLSAPGTVTVSWTASNSRCNASGDWSGAQTASGKRTFTNVSSNKTYTLSCTSIWGTTTKSATVTYSATTPPPAAPTVTISASPTSVTSGGSSTVTWSSTNATSCTASGSWSGTQSTSGTKSFSSLTADQTYTIACTGTGGTTTKSVTVTVTQPQTPTPTASISANPTSINSGDSTTVSWSSANATSCTASGSWTGSKGTSGSQTFSNLTSNQTYSISCSDGSGKTSSTQSVTVSVAAATPAPTVSLSASPTTVAAGGSTTLTWSSTNTTSCTASGSWSGSMPTSGTQTFTSLAGGTNQYTLSCSGAGGTATKSVVVTVTATTSPNTIDLSQYSQTFSDEFNTFSRCANTSAEGWGQKCSGGTWRTVYGRDGEANRSQAPYNNELDVNMDQDFGGYDPSTGTYRTQSLGINPFSIVNGALRITTDKTPESAKPYLWNLPYTSGVITTATTFTQTYGYWEMNAKLPKGKGMWPAFWLLSLTSWPPEVDIMESLGHDTNTYYTTVHFDGTPTNATTDDNSSGSCITYANASGCQIAPAAVMKGVDLSAGFHRYGVDVQPDMIKWYFDGTLVYSTSTPSQLIGTPLYILVNDGVGGGWAGAPDATTVFPTTMDIDYIRVYKKNSVALGTGSLQAQIASVYAALQALLAKVGH